MPFQHQELPLGREGPPLLFVSVPVFFSSFPPLHFQFHRYCIPSTQKTPQQRLLFTIIFLPLVLYLMALLFNQHLTFNKETKNLLFQILPDTLFSQKVRNAIIILYKMRPSCFRDDVRKDGVNRTKRRIGWNWVGRLKPV